MKKIPYISCVLALILSPLWLGTLANIGKSAGDDASLSVLAWTIIGIPIISVTGAVVGAVARKKPNASNVALLGFLIPAVIICACELYVVL